LTDSEYCIRITSSKNENLCGGADGGWINAWKGGSLELVHNGNVIHILPVDFTDEEKCLPIDQVDVTNDQFELRFKDGDGVSFSNLFASFLRFGNIKNFCSVTSRRSLFSFFSFAIF